MSHKGRIKRLEHQFSERAGARRLDEIFAAVQTGDVDALQLEERLETAAGGKRGWVANLFCSILQPLAADGALIQAEDLERPQ